MSTAGFQGAGHEPWEELAVGHALHALEPSDEEAFAAHLRTCDNCRALVAEFSEVATDLAYAPDSVEPPTSLWSGIAAAVAASDRPPLPSEATAGVESPALRPEPTPTPEPAPQSTRPVAVPPPEGADAARRPAWLRSTALALVAAVIGVVGLSGVVLVGRFLQVRSEKAAAERQLSAVLNCAGKPGCAVVPLKGQGGSSASAVALVQGGGVQLVVNDLPATDGNSSYVLWVERAGGGLTGVGRFMISNGGRHVISPDLQTPLAVQPGRALAVSREPGRAIPEVPSTAPTLQGRVA